MKTVITILVDSREHKPYRYKDSISKCLSAGDYSIEGMEHAISIERKQVCELVGIVGTNRERFERELAKLAKLEYAAIVIEGNISDALRPSAFSNVSPRAVINSLLSWSIRFGVHVFFADSRRYARALTYKLLFHFAKHRTAGDIVCRTVEISPPSNQEPEVTSGKPTRSESLPP